MSDYVGGCKEVDSLVPHGQLTKECMEPRTFASWFPSTEVLQTLTGYGHPLMT